MLRVLRGIVRVGFVIILLAVLGVAGTVGVTLMHFSRDLPSYQQLVDYVPAVGSKVYGGDGALLAEFEKEHRIPVKFDQVPRIVIEAFLAAEDRDFYRHGGFDPLAIFRAAMSDVLRLQRGQRPIGASTITQQVVRHFLLTNQVSVARKIKEMILAYRIEHTLSKDRILEIYLNEIYLGAGSYGVAAAADTYFRKPLDQLSVAQAAFLAALPKAPNNYNPLRHPAAAKARRDWVISGMADVGWISKAQAQEAIAEPLGIDMKPAPDQATSANASHDGYFVEEVRRELLARFGEKAVYEGGLSVHTSFVPSYEQMALKAFRDGLIAYDRRHGWRGPVAHLSTGAAAQAALLNTPDPPRPDGWQLAAVTAIDGRSAAIALRNGSTGHIPLSEMLWARHTLPDQQLGGAVHSVRDVVTPGDIVLVEPVGADVPERGRRGVSLGQTYALRQLPNVSGGVVVMDPKTGRVLALVGGWSFRQSQFDRAVQAMRQPGSSFKPFVYVTALENGFSPGSTVDDDPVSIPQGPGLPPWQPVNYESGYVGQTTLEDALVHSRNLATVHVALSIGLKPIAKTVEDFGVLDHMPLYYSMVLGAGDTTLMRMTGAYSMLDNGGHWLLPSLIDTVQDRSGEILYQKGADGCAACFVAAGPRKTSDESSLYRAAGPADSSWIWLPNAHYAENATIYKPTKPDPLVTPQADYQIVSMMQGVVQHGTGIAVAAVDKPLAGKTGTTSDWFDAWFVGFSPDLAAGVYVGFDEPRTLGYNEQGGHVAAPIFRDFMAAALKGKPATPFPVPEGVNPEIASATPATDKGDNADADDADAPDGATASMDANGMNPDTAASAAGADASGGGRRGQDGPDYAALPPDAGGPPQWSNNAPPSERDDRAGQAPRYPYPAPWVPDYAVSSGPRYRAPPPPPQAPGMPSYPPPAGWGMRPGDGTGGLY